MLIAAVVATVAVVLLAVFAVVGALVWVGHTEAQEDSRPGASATASDRTTPSQAATAGSGATTSPSARAGDPSPSHAAASDAVLPAGFNGYVSNDAPRDRRLAERVMPNVPDGTIETVYRKGSSTLVAGSAPTAAVLADPDRYSSFMVLENGTMLCQTISTGGGYCQRGGRVRTLLVVSNVSMIEARKALVAIAGP